MSAPEPQTGKVDPVIIAVDIACVVVGALAAGAVLFGANYLIATMIERHPALVDFMFLPWVAPAIVAAGIAILGGIAVLLVFSRPSE